MQVYFYKCKIYIPAVWSISAGLFKISKGGEGVYRETKHLAKFPWIFDV